MTDRELLEKVAKASGWTWWRSKHGYWNLTSPDGTQHTACHGWTKFNPHTGEAEPEPTPGDALLEVCFYPLYTTQPRREWVGLTDEAIWLEYQRFWPFHPAEEPKLAKDIAKFARAIEAKLKEKNT